MKKGRVLIVEDDEIIREFLFDSLSIQGFAATCVTNGEEALDSLALSEADLVLSDVRMPTMDGISLARHVRERFPHIPVILITGVHADERERILEESGAVACLSKPLRIQHLCEVLEKARAR